MTKATASSREFSIWRLRRKRNSSSNWSTTTRRFSSRGMRACPTTSTSPSVLRRSVASNSTAFVLARSSSTARTPGASSASARWPIGSSPGRRIATRQLEPAPAMKPLYRDGISPGADERRLAAAGGADDREEPGRAQPAQQIVDFLLAAEEEMIFVRLERTKARKGLNEMPPAFRRAGDERPQRSSVKPSHCGITVASCVRSRSLSGVRGPMRQMATGGFGLVRP